MIKTNCLKCNNEIQTYPCRLKKGLIYCSRICAAFGRIPPSRKGKIGWNKGGKAPWTTKRNLENNPFKGCHSHNYIQDRNKLVISEKKHLDVKYRDWMFSIKKRDNWKCKINNSDCRGRLEAHHILNWVDYPELRYDINNGISLCHAHHPRGRANEKRLSPYLKGLVSVPKE